MNLIPWRGKRTELDAPEHSPIERFRFDMDRLFDRFFGESWGGGMLDEWRAWSPSLDVTETEKEVLVRAEVPGVAADDLDIQVSGDVLTITGEKKDSTERKTENTWRVERRFGSFQRRVQLPAPIDREKVAAEHKDGVLTIRLAKTAGSVPRKIPVSTAK